MTPAVRLVPFTPGDAARLIGWVTPAGSPESLMQWAGPIFHWPLDEAQIGAYLAPAAGQPPARIVWRADAEDGTPVGHIELDGIDRGVRAARLARVLIAPARREEGFGRAMVAASLRFAFAGMGLERVTLNVFSFNTAAIGCYRSLGFLQEELVRGARRVGDAEWDIIRCALSATDWRRRRDEEEGDHAIRL